MWPSRRSLLFSSHEHSINSPFKSGEGPFVLPGPGVELRVVDGHRCTRGAPASIRVNVWITCSASLWRMADGVEARKFVEANRVDHETVAVPLADRMAVPDRFEILRMVDTHRNNVKPVVHFKTAARRSVIGLHDLEKDWAR